MLSILKSPFAMSPLLALVLPEFPAEAIYMLVFLIGLIATVKASDCLIRFWKDPLRPNPDPSTAYEPKGLGDKIRGEFHKELTDLEQKIDKRFDLFEQEMKNGRNRAVSDFNILRQEIHENALNDAAASKEIKAEIKELSNLTSRLTEAVETLKQENALRKLATAKIL